MGAFKQCGGKDWTGSTCCNTDLICKFDNEWYSQCKPILTHRPTTTTARRTTTTTDRLRTTTTTTTQRPEMPSALPTTTTEAPHTSTTKGGNAICMGAFKQCGGKDWTGSTCCNTDLICKFDNEWYSQCKPVLTQWPSASPTTTIEGTHTSTP